VEIRAFSHPDNVASRRVLAKSGFVVDRYVTSMNRFLYAQRTETAQPQPSTVNTSSKP
jgi:RimJ/RimL family protein N-acetyltransferase